MYVNLDIIDAASAQVVPKLQLSRKAYYLSGGILHYCYITVYYQYHEGLLACIGAGAKSDENGLVMANMRQKLPTESESIFHSLKYAGLRIRTIWGRMGSLTPIEYRSCTVTADEYSRPFP
jgi:hypothetical protein